MQPKSIRILIIEDDHEQASFLFEFLTGLKDEIASFEAETADHLASGLRELGQGGYDIVLLDLNLPDSQGIETFIKVASQAPKLPIIPLTGSGDQRLALEAMSLGAQDYLVKGTFSAGILTRTILYALERKRLIGQLEDLITKNVDGMVVVDSAGWVRQVNPAAEIILGMKAELLVGRPFDFPVFPDQVTELKFPTPDGQEKIAEMRVSEIEWQGKSACLASIRDITELKRLEQLKAEVKEHHRLDKLKDDFMASVSSELRAPLTVLHGAIYNLLSGIHGALNEAQAKTAEVARKSAERLMRAINNILDISRLESGKMELHCGPVNVGILFDEAVNNLSTRAQERGITMEIRIAHDLPRIDVDAELISQALAHLLDNALRFAKSKVILQAKSIDGPLPAGSSTVKRSPGLGVTLVSARRGVQISIIDDGIGIPKEQLGQLFKKFVHAQRTTMPNGSQGTGLGLAICKHIIQSHHGKIWAESAETCSEQGTQFHFILPQFAETSSRLKKEDGQQQLPTNVRASRNK